MSQVHRIATVTLTAVSLATVAFSGNGTPVFLGPTAYTSQADSVFDIGASGVCLETFEDNSFAIPGVSGNASVFGPNGLADSVDGDDGNIDGFGTAGRSYFSFAGTITITFDPLASHGLPTQAGMVWTDGGLGMGVTFEAFGPLGASLGTNGPNLHADLSNNGETGEDRFYGVEYLDGISAITLSNPGGGIEIDHLQYNNCYICGDGSGDYEIKAVDALFALKAAVGTESCSLCVCDVNTSDTVTALDSLIILKAAVGQPVELNCPSCAAMIAGE